MEEYLNSTRINDQDQEITTVQGHGVEDFVLQEGADLEISDRLISSWLLGSMTEDILKEMLDEEITKQIEMVDSLKKDEDKVGNKIYLIRTTGSDNNENGAAPNPRFVGVGVDHFPFSAKNQYLRAMVAAPDPADTEPFWWYVDSGATHHVTKYVANFSSFSPCNGRKFVRFSNGTTLFVEHTGSSHFTFGSRSCILKKLLHVPSISKNFISVSQFTKDNAVCFEFDPVFCYLKDGLTGRILLVGDMFDGMYRFLIRIH